MIEAMGLKGCVKKYSQGSNTPLYDYQNIGGNINILEESKMVYVVANFYEPVMLH